MYFITQNKVLMIQLYSFREQKGLLLFFFNFVKVYPYFQAITPGMQWVLCNPFYDSLLFGANSIYELEFAKIYIWRPPPPNALHMLGSFPINFPYSLKRYTLPLIEHRTYS